MTRDIVRLPDDVRALIVSNLAAALAAAWRRQHQHDEQQSPAQRHEDQSGKECGNER